MVCGHCRASTTLSTPLASVSLVVVEEMRTELSPSQAAVRAARAQTAGRRKGRSGMILILKSLTSCASWGLNPVKSR
jgi:hypothetical protein